MSVKFLPFNPNMRAFTETNMYSFYSLKSFLWGKCYHNEEGNFIGVQSPVICKDYVVDTYFTTITGGYAEKDTFLPHKYDPCFYIICPTITLKQMIMKRIISHVNAYEEKHGFKPTVAYDVECDYMRDTKYNKYVICFEFDPQWMINSTAMSVYLSMVRCFIHTTQETDLGILRFDAVRECNENVYYPNLSTVQKHLISYLYNNPKLLIVDTTKLGYEKSGFKKATGHGASGLFYAMKQLDNQRLYYYNTWKGVKNNCSMSWFYDVLHQWVTEYTWVDFYNHPDPVAAGIILTKGNYMYPAINIEQGIIKLLEHLTNGGALEYVKPVQSVQQKVVRKRAVKKIPKQGTEDMLLGTV